MATAKIRILRTVIAKASPFMRAKKIADFACEYPVNNLACVAHTIGPFLSKVSPLDHSAEQINGKASAASVLLHTGSGNFTMFTAVRRASSLVSNLTLIVTPFDR